MSKKTKQLQITQQELATASRRRLQKMIATAAALILGICVTVGVAARWNGGVAFTPAPPPTPTPTPPTLSREYLYAGSRLLAVEDAGAQPASGSDLAVWRPSTGTWYVLTASGTVSQQWGLSTDLLAPGDYDGDGKQDFSVYRPGSAGAFYILKTSDGNLQAVTFGASGDVPAPGDYDGDGRTDVALYRGSNSTFYVIDSANGTVQSLQVGSSGDLRAAADYDGDGRVDPAVFRGSNGTWYWLKSGDGYSSTSYAWGQSGDVPVPGDYNGDGKTDYAYFRSGTWYVQYNCPSCSNTSTSWGLSSDNLVPGDYDGDGTTDIAVWRAGAWYILKSTAGYYSTNFGQSGDLPVPGPYRR
jgi:hypothetical protein